MEPESGLKKCCRLVGISYKNNSIFCAYWHLQFTRSVGLLMTAALRKGPGTVIEEINSKHSELSRSQLQQVNFLHIPHIPKRPQDKMLNIPNYCRRNAKLKDTKKSVPTCQNGHPHKSTNNKLGWEPGGEETPLGGQCEWTLETDPLKLQKSSAHGLTYPHLGLYPEKTASEKDTGTPSFTAEPGHRTSQMSPDRLKVKEDVYIHTMDYYSVMRNGHWNYATEIMPQGSTLEDHRLSEVSWMEKDNFAL